MYSLVTVEGLGPCPAIIEGQLSLDTVTSSHRTGPSALRRTTRAMTIGHLMTASLATAQIGKCGELLVQYRLLLLGIETAPMSTDTGIDLVAYSPNQQTAFTIQVKANLKAKPGGGRGKAALDWWIRDSSPAQFVALVDLSSETVWLLSHAELLDHAQQRSSGRAHIYMYTDPTASPRKTDRLSLQGDFEQFLLWNRAVEAFGLTPELDQ